MDKYDGIKRASVKVKRNDYKASSEYKPKILWRYIVAAFIVLAVMTCGNFTSYDAGELFKQDYIEQYEK